MISRFGLISHILHPSPSGQAVVLFRLLRSLRPDEYCLILTGAPAPGNRDNSETANPSVLQHTVKTTFRLPESDRSYLFAFSIVFNALVGICRRARKIREIALQEDCDLLIACTGDLYDLPASYLASKWAGVPFVAYLFDDYCFQWTGFYRAIAKCLEPAILRNAKAIIVPNEFMKEEYRKRYGTDSIVIHNPCALPDLQELDTAPKILSDQQINIVYTGSVYHAHYDAFRNLIAAIKHLGRTDVKLHIYTSQSESELERHGISGRSVVYHAHIESSRVAVVTRQADILFLPLAFNSQIPEVIRTSAPGKTGEYLASGRPILIHAPDDCFISWYFRQHQCGVVVSSQDPTVLSDAIAKLLSDGGLNEQLCMRARQMAEKEFDADILAAAFIKYITDLRKKT